MKILLEIVWIYLFLLFRKDAEFFKMIYLGVKMETIKGGILFYGGKMTRL